LKLCRNRGLAGRLEPCFLAGVRRRGNFTITSVSRSAGAAFTEAARRAPSAAGPRELPGELQSKTFLSGGGAVGALMRRHDWSDSPLGPPETWPQSLRSVVGLLLNSKFPMFVAWGEELGLLYNDAYAEILGAKHPASLGARFHDIWSEVWTDIWPLIEAAMAGQASYQEDLPLLMNRHGYDEETWFTFSLSPVRDDAGKVAGMFCAVTETTSRMRGAQRQAFLFEADNALRDLDDAAEILSASAELLGRHFAADRVHWAWIDDAAGAFRVEEEWTRGDARSLRGVHRLEDFGENLIAVMRRGGLMAVTDLQSVGLPKRTVAAFGPELRGALSVPLFRGERWQTALCVHAFSPRTWRDDEQELIREFAERAWTRAERGRAEAHVRLSEQRLRALVNATSDVIYRMSADWREISRLDGRGFLAEVFRPSVAWMDEYLPTEDRAAVVAAVRQAIKSKGVYELEHRVRRSDGTLGWILSRAVPLLDERGNIVEWFGTASDITQRKLAEEHLRLMVNELNHRVKNSLATVQGIATQTLRRGDIPAEVREALTQRLLALAAAHDVLTDERWRGARNLRTAALRPAADRHRPRAGAARVGDQRGQVRRPVRAGRPGSRRLVGERRGAREALAPHLARAGRSGGERAHQGRIRQPPDSARTFGRTRRQGDARLRPPWPGLPDGGGPRR
jgi:PAS domain-containing protein